MNMDHSLISQNKLLMLGPFARKWRIFGISGTVGLGLLSCLSNLTNAQVAEPKLNAPEFGKLGRKFQQQLNTIPLRPLRTTTAAAVTATLDPRKSVFITDLDTVAKLTFSDVMEQLAQQSSDPTLTKLALFRQWWDSQNKPG